MEKTDWIDEKKTPLQNLQGELESSKKLAGHEDGLLIDAIIKTIGQLLPVEKQWAKEVWEAGQREIYGPETNPDFPTY